MCLQSGIEEREEYTHYSTVHRHTSKKKKDDERRKICIWDGREKKKEEEEDLVEILTN